MPTNITYATILSYLDAIAASATRDISFSPHGAFWTSATNPSGYLSYAQFVAGTIPGVTCASAPVPIIDRSNLPGSASNSAFFAILTNEAGWCSYAQMVGRWLYRTYRNVPKAKNLG
jgi:hypothetical protein